MIPTLDEYEQIYKDVILLRYLAHELDKNGQTIVSIIDGEHEQIRFSNLRTRIVNTKGKEKRAQYERALQRVLSEFKADILEGYKVTSESLLLSYSGESKQQYEHMDSDAHNHFVLAQYFVFPWKWDRLQIPDMVVPTRFKDIAVDLHVSRDDFDQWEPTMHRLTTVDWVAAEYVGPELVANGDCVLFHSRGVHHGPGFPFHDPPLIRVALFRYYQPFHESNEFKAGKETQISEYIIHLVDHPKEFYEHVRAGHRFTKAMIEHPTEEWNIPYGCTHDKLNAVLSAKFEAIKELDEGVVCKICRGDRRTRRSLCL
jgi:hypothetical protein